MAYEVKLDLKDFAARWDRRGAKSACGDVEGDLPAVIEPGRQPQADLADDLRPELQGCGCVAPSIIGQIGPNGHGIVHGLLLSRRILCRLVSMVVATRAPLQGVLWLSQIEKQEFGVGIGFDGKRRLVFDRSSIAFAHLGAIDRHDAAGQLQP